MRLSNFQINAIKETFTEVFKTGEVYLFGSRTDDSKLGGDIDLYLEVAEQFQTFDFRIEFLAKLKRKIGDQKIDLVFPGRLDPLFEKEIEKCKIPL